MLPTRHASRSTLRVILSVLLLIVLFLMLTPTQAADFNIDCTVASLVNAITTSGTNGEADTINLTAGCTYTLSSQLDVAADGGFLLTINGNGSTISGNNASRVFNIASGANAVINGLVITDGNPGFVNGGGISNSGTLTLTSSTVSSSEAFNGAGINNFGTLTLNHTTVSGNDAAVGGGGMYNNSGAIVTLNHSTFSDNSAGSAHGGGIYNLGTLTINNSTISGNSAGASSGGIYQLGGTATLNNSTVSSNSANVIGAGIVANIAPVILNNSIIANSQTSPDCAMLGTGTVTPNHSLIEDGSCGVGTSPPYANGNLSGDPSLGAAETGSNGTQYFPLNTGSIAIDAGDNALIPAGVTTDQAGNPRIRALVVDMGSFEAPPAALNILLTLQARPPAPHPSWITTVDVEVRPSGGGTPILSGQYTSDNQGRVAITGMLTGSYDLWIKGTHTLALVHAITLVAGANSLTTDPLLEGDANDDNEIRIPDFSILSGAFGMQTGDAAFDTRADFNADGRVTLIDFSLLAVNFGQDGAP